MSVLPKLLKDGNWFKSTESEAMGECVEVAFVAVVAVRDSKAPEGPVLYFTPDEWTAFTQGVRNGEFDQR